MLTDLEIVAAVDEMESLIMWDAAQDCARDALAACAPADVAYMLADRCAVVGFGNL